MPRSKRQQPEIDENSLEGPSSSSFHDDSSLEPRKRARVETNGYNHAREDGTPSQRSNDYNHQLSYQSQSQASEYNVPHTSQQRNSQPASSQLTQSQSAGSSGAQHLQRLRENRAAENGIIEEVSCTNFMCHSRLEVKLGPLINFIIGHNGSGKSAVLTALTLCLGGKTASTNRGGNLKAFIKEGEEQAVLSVKIKNQGDGSFKPDVYGRSIIVERHFSRTGTSGFKIKNAHGKIISTKRTDLEDITDAFALQLDNPMMVLTQDMAREFLNNSTPTDKYKFFYKGTQLETLDKDYGLMEEMLDAIEDKLRLKDDDIAVLEREHAEAAKKAELAERHLSIADRLKELGHQMAWAQVEEQERAAATYEANVAKVNKKLEAIDKDIENSEAQLEDQNAMIARAKAVVEEAVAAQEERRPELERISEEVQNTHRKLMEIVQQERDIRGELQTAKKNLAKTQHDISEEESRIERADGGLFARKQEELLAAKRQVEEAQADLANHVAQFNALEETLRRYDRDRIAAEESVRRKENELRTKQNIIRQLQHDSGRWSQAYPQQLPALLRAIDNVKSQFCQHPVGPMGRHLRLKEPRWSSVLERSFGNSLQGFVVTNREDQRLLDSLMQRTGYPRLIYVGDSDRINTRPHEPAEHITTTLRVLEIDNDLVHNQLVINNAIEQTALVDTVDEARYLIVEERPRNVKRCFGLNKNRAGAGVVVSLSGSGGTVLSPTAPWTNLPRMQSDVDRQIEHETSDLNQLRAEHAEEMARCREVRQVYAKAESDLQAHRFEERRIRDRVERYRHKAEQLEDEVENDKPVTGHIDALRKDLADNQQEVDQISEAFKDAVSQKEELNRQLATLKSQEQEITKVISELEPAILKARNKERRAFELRDRVFSEKTRILQLRQDCEAQRDALVAELEQQMQVVEEFSTLAGQIVARVPVPPGETSQSLDQKMSKLRHDRARYEAELGGSLEDLSKRLLDAQERLNSARDRCRGLEATAQALKHALFHRRERWSRFRQHISTRARTQFVNKLSQRKFRGRMVIDHDRKELDIKVEPDINRSSGTGRQTKTLSGGEKSFATICLLLALWDAMGSTIRCLDEFDVFMDNVNRAASMSMMIDAARESVSRQFILISPQAMGNVDVRNDVRIIKMRDPERGQTTLSFAGT